VTRDVHHRQAKNTGTPSATIAEQITAFLASAMNMLATMPKPETANTSGSTG